VMLPGDDAESMSRHGYALGGPSWRGIYVPTHSAIVIRQTTRSLSSLNDTLEEEFSHAYFSGLAPSCLLPLRNELSIRAGYEFEVQSNVLSLFTGLVEGIFYAYRQIVLGSSGSYPGQEMSTERKMYAQIGERMIRVSRCVAQSMRSSWGGRMSSEELEREGLYALIGFLASIIPRREKREADILDFLSKHIPGVSWRVPGFQWETRWDWLNIFMIVKGLDHRLFRVIPPPEAHRLLNDALLFLQRTLAVCDRSRKLPVDLAPAIFQVLSAGCFVLIPIFYVDERAGSVQDIYIELLRSTSGTKDFLLGIIQNLREKRSRGKLQIDCDIIDYCIEFIERSIAMAATTEPTRYDAFFGFLKEQIPRWLQAFSSSDCPLCKGLRKNVDLDAFAVHLGNTLKRNEHLFVDVIPKYEEWLTKEGPKWVVEKHMDQRWQPSSVSVKTLYELI
jgi:hypothetical protein